MSYRKGDIPLGCFKQSSGIYFYINNYNAIFLFTGNQNDATIILFPRKRNGGRQ